MSELDDRCLAAFPEWLRALPEDATDLADTLPHEELPESARVRIAAALNYLFKSLDLIPDGIEDLGFLDDAFVLRVSAKFAAATAGDNAPMLLIRLAGEAKLVEELLGKDFGRLERYVDGLTDGSVRGRSPSRIVTDHEAREALRTELEAWASSYSVPSFLRDSKTLVKLTSFLGAKLPT